MPTSFPLNAWDAAAGTSISSNALFSAHDLRQACRDVPPVQRTSRALEDACWHRLGAAVQRETRRRQPWAAASHGLKIQRAGPLHLHALAETINPSACVRSYPVVERHRSSGCGWGRSRALADPTLVPDCMERRPGLGGDGKTIHVKCDYRLVSTI